MNKIRRAFIDTPEFGQIHIRTAGSPGEKPPIICLHQSPKSSREFIKLMGAADGSRHLIAIDNPGHGESDVPQLPPIITDYARCAWQVLDQMGVREVDILGHHTGAKVATEMAYQQAERAQKILMISALVLTPEEQADFASQFQPIPLDEAGTRFSTMWEKSIEFRGPGVSLIDLAASYAENLRSGEAYEWGHQAAFAYNQFFPERVASLPHNITVLNPGDMLYEHTPRVMPLLQNGTLIDKPDWGFGFMDCDTVNAAKLIFDVFE